MRILIPVVRTPTASAASSAADASAGPQLAPDADPAVGAHAWSCGHEEAEAPAVSARELAYDARLEARQQNENARAMYM